jgi:DEAD/DEAH box helicase domain-containing protein
MPDMLDAFLKSMVQLDLSVIESIDLPARPEQLEQVPAEYLGGHVGRWLGSDKFVRGVWTHQADALRAFEAGAKVVISTGMASGKSLVFQAATLRMLDERPRGAVLVLYPLKALVADQLVSWRKILQQAGYPEETIGRIDGDVPPEERERVLRTARIVVATPDVIHAWLMSNLAKPEHKRFLGRLKLLVIDEAHVFESVFGSNFAYLFRRIAVAARMTDRSEDPEMLRVVAASATISNPAAHLYALTGLSFETVGESSGGSPQHARRVYHVAVEPGEELSVAAHVQKALLSESDVGSFITFIDSRQGAERLAIRTDAEAIVRPYRSGYESSDREAIEAALRGGSLRGVVSTSALELGIDIPHFSVGLNIGIPASRKSFRQRLGRVGRRKPGAFALLAEPYAFKRYGTSLHGYYAESIEPSFLYLQNRFIQYAHARCLADELEMLGVTGRKVLPSIVDWPDEFKSIFEFAYVGGPSVRPREFDPIHRVGQDAPHYNYPLRNVAEESFIVTTGGGRAGPPRRVGSLTLQQAIREAFPGAIYLHLAKGWRVYEWRSTTWDRAIRVGDTPSRTFPRPLLRTFVNVSLERDGIVDGRFRLGESGFLAECQLQIAERVEGFQDRGERKLYRDLQGSDPNMRSKTREFRTTGVILRVGEPWFLQKGIKERIAEVLRTLILREYSISPSDVDSCATNIAIVRDGQRSAVVDAIVLYDATHGSLRLTEPAYTRLDHILNRLGTAVSMTPDEADLLPAEVVESLSKWYRGLSPEGGDIAEFIRTQTEQEEKAGWLQVYKPGSIVCRRGAQGLLHEIEILEPEIVSAEGPPRLYYRYRLGRAGKAMAPADTIEATGDEWSFVYWNPETGEYVDAIDDLVVRETDRPAGLTDSLTGTEI